MAKLQLNKSSLSREQKNLKTYRQFLPSLDLKRQELMRQQANAKKALRDTEDEINKLLKQTGDEIPMLSNERIDLNELVKVTKVEITTENIMGASLPVLEKLEIKQRQYSFLAKPHWVDAVVARLKKLLMLKIRGQIEKKRVELLNHTVKTITQRVNLFEKVLIPRAQENIKRIKIYLSDTERANIVIAKVAKKKRQMEIQQ